MSNINTSNGNTNTPNGNINTPNISRNTSCDIKNANQPQDTKTLTNHLENVFSSLYNIEIECSPDIEPLDGIPITMENKEELDKETYYLEDEYLAKMSTTLIAVTLNGAKIYLETPIFGKPSKKDTFMYIVRYKYPRSWHLLFSSYGEYFEQISDVINNIESSQLTPSINHIFRAFELTPLHNVKVVIFAPEPCNKAGEATGLAYGNFKGPDDTLKAIYNEIYLNFKQYYDEIKYSVPHHAILNEWALQGVLLLHMSLTGIVGEKLPHKDLWISFVRKAIEIICNQNENVIFMLWGSNTKIIKEFIPNTHTCLTASHPLFRGNCREPFQGCNHFIEANNILINENKTTGIKWRLLPQ